MTTIRVLYAFAMHPSGFDEPNSKRYVFDEEYFLKNPLECTSELSEYKTFFGLFDTFLRNKNVAIPTFCSVGYVYSTDDSEWNIRALMLKRVALLDVDVESKNIMLNTSHQYYTVDTSKHTPDIALNPFKELAPNAYLKYMVPNKELLSLGKYAARALFLADQNFRFKTAKLRENFPEEILDALPETELSRSVYSYNINSFL